MSHRSRFLWMWLCWSNALRWRACQWTPPPPPTPPAGSSRPPSSRRTVQASAPKICEVRMASWKPPLHGSSLNQSQLPGGFYTAAATCMHYICSWLPATQRFCSRLQALRQHGYSVLSVYFFYLTRGLNLASKKALSVQTKHFLGEKNPFISRAQGR